MHSVLPDGTLVPEAVLLAHRYGAEISRVDGFWVTRLKGVTALVTDDPAEPYRPLQNLCLDESGGSH